MIMVDQIAGTNLAENSPHRWSRRHKLQGYAVDAVAQVARVVGHPGAAGPAGVGAEDHRKGGRGQPVLQRFQARAE